MANKQIIHHRPSLKTLAWRFVVVIVAYVAFGQLGLTGPYKSSIATLLWLPSGIAVGAFMCWGRVTIPAIFIAAMSVELSLGIPLVPSFSIAIGNTLAPLCTAFLLKKFHSSE